MNAYARPYFIPLVATMLAVLVPLFAQATTYTWTGAVNNLWSNANNWNPVGVPTDGDTLAFPTGPAIKAVTNDLTPASPYAVFNVIAINGSGYTLNGNGIALTGGVAGQSATFNLPIQLAANQTLTNAIYAGGIDAQTYNVSVAGTVSSLSGSGSVSASGTISGGSFSGSITGIGSLSIAGMPALTSLTQSASNSSLTINGDMPSLQTLTLGTRTSTTANGRNLSQAAVMLQGASFNASNLSASGTTGSLTTTSATQLFVSGTPSILNTGNLILGGSTSHAISGAAPGTGFPQIKVTGTLTIQSSASLDVSMSTAFIPALGQEFILISNDVTDAIVGIFSGRAQNSVITLNSVYQFQLTYTGGDGNDVSLISLNGKQAPTIDLTSSQNPSTTGSSVTFTATVNGIYGNGTGNVSFYSGATLLITKALTSGSASHTVSDLTAGSHNISVEYAGDTNYGGGSDSLTQVVNTPVCTTPASGLVAWYQASGNANDSAGTNHGTLMNGATFTTGKVGNAFALNGSQRYINIPASPSLNVGTGAGFTFEGWINAPNVSFNPILEYNHVSVPGVHFHIESGRLHLNVVDTGFNYHNFDSAYGIVAPNTWQHVAATYDKASGNARLYLNGAEVANGNLGSFTPLTSADLQIGARLCCGAGQILYFNGSIDELSIYNRALSSSELQSIYLSSTEGKCPNTPPTITAGAPATRARGSAASKVTIATVDDAQDGNGSLAVIATSVPSGISISKIAIASGTVSADVGAGCAATPGTNNVTLQVTDSGGLTATAMFVVNVTDPSPVLGDYSTTNLSTGAGTSVTPTAAPSDNGSVTSVTATSPTFTGTLSANTATGVVTISDANAGTHTVTVTATDNCGTTSQKQFTLHVVTPACSMPPGDLTAWYRAEGNGNDETGNHNGALEGGVSFAPGRVGSAFSLDGIDDAVRVNSPFVLHQPGDATVEFWLNTPADTHRAILWTRGDSLDENRFNIYYNGDATFGFDYRAPSGNLHLLIDAIPIPRNAWVHLAITRAGNVYTLYVNGTFAATVTDFVPELPTATSWQIAGRQSYRMSGKLDEVTTYRRALSGSEIQAIYASTVTGKCVPPAVLSGPHVNPANQHTYYLLKEGLWPAALMRARWMNGDLATVRSSSENQYIFNTLGPVAVSSTTGGGTISLWLGLNDAAAEGTFVWSSGETVGYTNWQGGEPGGNFTDEDYAGMLAVTGEWHDVVGDTRFGDRTYGLVEIIPENTNPVITAASPATRAAGAAASSSPIATVSDGETPAGDLVVTATTVPAGITISNITNTNGNVTAMIAADCTAAVGPNQVTLEVEDGFGTTATANFTVNVTNPIQLVSFGSNQTLGYQESANLTAILQGPGPFSVTVSDGNGGTRTFTGSSPITMTYSPTATTTYTIVALEGNAICPGALPPLAQRQVTVTVPPNPTSTTITTDPPYSVVGEQIKLIAKVSAATTPAGSVVFKDGATTLGTVSALTGNTATLTIIPTVGGPHTYSAHFSSATFAPSSGSVLHQIAPGATTVTLTTSKNPGFSGTQITYSSTVKPKSPATGTPAGKVKFYANGSLIGTGTLSAGKATYIHIYPPQALTYQVVAKYDEDNDDPSFDEGVSPVVYQTIALPIAVGLATSVNPATVGLSVHFTATISGGAGTPSGTMRFYDGTTLKASISVASRTVVWTATGLTAGTHPIKAVYTGTGAFAGSFTSPTISQSVNP